MSCVTGQFDVAEPPIRNTRGFFIAAGVVAALILLALTAPWIWPVDPLAVNLEAGLAQPSPQHPLGTDALGRDVLSRLLHGGRTCLWLSFIAAGIGVGIGLLLGTLAGYLGGKVDHFIHGLIVVFQSLPGPVLLLVLAGWLGSGPWTLIPAMAVTSWSDPARIFRSTVMRLRNAYYVDNVRVLGAPLGHILLREIIPQMQGLILVFWSARAGALIPALAALGFLGLGMQAPTPDWGAMILEARPYFRERPLLLLAPGLAAAVAALAFHFLGDETQGFYRIERMSRKDC